MSSRQFNFSCTAACSRNGEFVTSFYLCRFYVFLMRTARIALNKCVERKLKETWFPPFTARSTQSNTFMSIHLAAFSRSHLLRQINVETNKMKCYTCATGICLSVGMRMRYNSCSFDVSLRTQNIQHTATLYWFSNKFSVFYANRNAAASFWFECNCMFISCACIWTF